jgi:hypothetical protein
MKSRFKSNNFIAIIIALILFAVGFLLLFIHKQSESTQTRGQIKTVMINETSTLPAYEDRLAHSILIRAIRTGNRPERIV